MEYRYVYLSQYGYVVYVHYSDRGDEPVEVRAEKHRCAVFVEEADASDYCDYRNSKLK